MAEDLSAFDPELFMNSDLESGFETSFTKVPEGEWSATIDDVRIEKIQLKDDKGEAVKMTVNWAVTDPAVKEETGMEKPIARQGFFLDITDSGTLDRGKGKNVRLGQILEATGIGNDGSSWSPAGLKGLSATVQVKHKPNPDDPENPFVNVTKVAAD